MLKLSLAIVLLAGVAAFGQPQGDYRLDTETILQGSIQRVVKHSVHGHTEVHLLLLSEGREYEVHLAPPQYLVWRQFQFHAGDKVSIEAAKARGEPHYLARTVTLGSRTLELRDSQGAPLWNRKSKR